MQPKPFTPRQIKNRQKKIDDKIAMEKSQRPIEKLLISIEWKKSKIWGRNPHATAGAWYSDDKECRFEARDGYKCSGCGYDKESTVIAAIFNDFLKYRLWHIGSKNLSQLNTRPYGIYATHNEELNIGLKYSSVSFAGGIGTSCYKSISEFIGGKFERIASGKHFDVFVFTMNKKVNTNE